MKAFTLPRWGACAPHSLDGSQGPPLLSFRKSILRGTQDMGMQWPREVDVGLEPPEKNAWPNSACATGAHGHALAQAVSIQRGNPGARGVTSGMSLPSLSLSFPCCQRGRWPPPASEPPPGIRRTGGRYPHTSTENPSRAVLTQQCPTPDLKVLRPFCGKSQNIQKVPALRREAVGPGSLLVYPKAAATTAAPAPGPSACLAPSQGWGEGPGHCWKQTLCLCGHGLLFQGQGSEGSGE